MSLFLCHDCHVTGPLLYACRSLFYDQEREDGYTYVEDVLERLKKNPVSHAVNRALESVCVPLAYVIMC